MNLITENSMPQRIFEHLDLQMVFLNVTSLGSVIAWATEHASGIGGGFVLFTVGVLNLSKAYSTVKKAEDKNEK